MKILIMAGGQGTRFWPLSRSDRPKQFLQISGEQTMFQETISRLEPLVGMEDIFVVCSRRYAETVREQAPGLEQEQIIVEPAPRNTAPCIGFASLYLRERFPGEVTAVLPADHVIRHRDEFHSVLRSAEGLARAGWLCTFGIKPSFASTGYGYVEKGEAIPGPQENPAFRVKRFTEKPNQSRAEEFLRRGGFYWNSGMFVWSLDSILFEFDEYMPELGRGLDLIRQNWEDAGEVARIFGAFEKTSIDYGVMEKTTKAAVLPCDLGWNDVGSWQAVQAIREGDERGIVRDGECEIVDSRNCLVVAKSDREVALVGLEGVIVIDTPDALLVCAADRSQEVRRVVERLKKRNSRAL